MSISCAVLEKKLIKSERYIAQAEVELSTLLSARL
jgi:hypothetical protein